MTASQQPLERPALVAGFVSVAPPAAAGAHETQQGLAVIKVLPLPRTRNEKFGGCTYSRSIERNVGAKSPVS